MLDDFLFVEDGGTVRKHNIIGISSDHASNMISSKKAGVTNRLQSDIESLVVTHDLCHAFNLIIEGCLEKFPYEYRSMVIDLSKAFSKSAVKIAQFKALLNEPNETNLAVKRYIDTRWTSFVDCLERILKLAKPLEAFFSVENTQKKAKNERKTRKLETRVIRQKKDYFNPENRLMLELLLALLKKLVFYIESFEKDNLETTQVVRLIKRSQVIMGEYLYKTVPDERIEPYYRLLPIINSDEEDQICKQSLRQNEEFEEYFLKQNSESIPLLRLADPEGELGLRKKFFKYAREFFETAFSQMKKRLPDSNSIIMKADCILLRNPCDIDTLRELGIHFSNVFNEKELTDFNNELERLAQDRFELNRLIEQHRKKSNFCLDTRGSIISACLQAHSSVRCSTILDSSY